jgi:hypothetical protein
MACETSIFLYGPIWQTLSSKQFFLFLVSHSSIGKPNFFVNLTVSCLNLGFLKCFSQFNRLTKSNYFLFTWYDRTHEGYTKIFIHLIVECKSQILFFAAKCMFTYTVPYKYFSYFWYFFTRRVKKLNREITSIYPYKIFFS